MMNLDEIRAADLRCACIHEHAHAAVARHFGIPTIVTIRQNPNGSVDEERFWGGRCQTYGKPSPSQGRLIGLAGEVATAFDSDPEVVAWEIEERFFYESESISETDKAMIGEWTEEDIEEDIEACLTLVKKLWHEIVWDAEIDVTSHAKSAEWAD